ncbi:MAG: hypothetical protein KDD55_05250 [Bdellovibrionales bacterium]|nr:hypothetical protein [Bdellovibrionales bacterium]
MIAELVLRIVGYPPRLPGSQYSSPLLHQDAVLGWAPSTGDHRVVWPGVNEKGVEVTYDSLGARISRNSDCQGPNLLIFGDSVIHGYGLPNDKTIPWKLQELLSEKCVLNFGVDGYGHYQAYLRYKLVTSQFHLPPSIVIFRVGRVLIERDTLPTSHVAQVSQFQPSADLFAPRISVENETLREHPAQWQYLHLPFRRLSAFVALLEELYLRVTGYQRIEYSEKATSLLLEQVRSYAKQRGDKLFFLRLYRTEQTVPLDRQKSNIIDCTSHDLYSSKFTLTGDSHPNERGTDVIAHCVAHALDSL